jgi:hypothetical protein
MGIIDYFRIPKRGWYWYRNEYAKVPPPEWPAAGEPAALRLEADKKEGIATDGTDSTWLLVTVLDANGKPISNSPPVEFTIVKGPGEFPTGPSIAFDSKSDIRILDGMAAITFRSYYAGETVIRATSPGLKPAEVTLHFTGKTPWQEGKTPAVAARPYVRYDRKIPPPQNQSFGRNNPAYPSSAADGHPGAAADDGDAKTYWQPAANDADPSLTIDLERFVNFSRVKATFGQSAVYPVKVEVSDDQKDWQLAADLTHRTDAAASLDLAVSGGVSGRFVRLHFIGMPANTPPQVCELEVIGALKSQ